MNTLATDPTHEQGPAGDAALSSLVGLARLSRLTLLYHGPVTAGDGGREQAAALARCAELGEIAVLFDAGSDMRLADLLAAIEESVLEARPQAPLAPPMAGPVEALLSWQQALDVRFLLIFHRFDAALASPDPAFEQVLLQLVRDPVLDLSLLLMMDEAAAPALARLKPDIPGLGEDYLRMPDALAPPEPAGSRDIQAQLSPALTTETEHEPEPEPASLFPESWRPEAFAAASMQLPPEAAMPPLEQDDPFIPPLPPQDPASGGNADEAQAQALQRRRRPFPSLLEQAAPAFPLETGDTGDGAGIAARTEDSGEPAAAHAYRERLPLPLSAWMHKRQGRRRRATLAAASSAGMSTGILFVFMVLLVLVCWELPQLS